MASETSTELTQTYTEQTSRAELLRARAVDNLEKRSEKLKEKDKDKQNGLTKPFPISPAESGFGIMIGLLVDAFEFLGAIVAPITAAANIIPVLGQVVSAIGLAIAGASAVIGAVFSGIMFLGIAMWFLYKGIYPDTPRNITLYIALVGTTFGNAVFNWFPAWFGFFFWLFYRFYKQKLVPFSAGSKK